MMQPGEESVTGDATLDAQDMVTEILLRLPPVSVLRCRAVCKAWHRIATDPSFLAAHADRRPAQLLVGSKSKPSFLDTIPLSLQLQVDDLSQLHCPKQCEVSDLLGCCDGLLLFQESLHRSFCGSVLFVCNPVTRQAARLDLRPPSCPGFIRLCGFYRHAPSGELRLLVLANEPQPAGSAAHYVYSLAADDADASKQHPRRLGPVADGLDLALDQFAYFINHYAHHRGKIHWTIHPLARRTQKILAFDTVSEDFRLMSRPADHCCNEYLCLLELDGRLAVTAPGLHGGSTELWVLEDYDDDQSWSHRFRIVLPPRFSRPDWCTATGVPNVVFVSRYPTLYHLTDKRIVKEIQLENDKSVYCYIFKDSLVPHAFLNPY
ncbi:hypothetical protein D1007_16135 [Hordeum vulgare]|uniref:F-box domain-containing protein n=2 Tax=Hordeum vulgare subsp. vulgare TaxID=112509 RepID=A0A8I7BD03_HORVV|nr:hypothetical protein D1007_16135 [Hordeum vulgare]